jgi:ferredoxin
MNQDSFNLKIEDAMCVKCGACMTLYPDIFKFDEDGKIVVLKSVQVEKISKIKESCPVGAIVENK